MKAILVNEDKSLRWDSVPDPIIKSDEARLFYIVLVVVNVLKSAALVWVLVDTYRAVCRIIKGHTGYVLGMERPESTEASMVERLQAELKKNFIIALAFAGVYVVSDICYDVFAPKVGFMGLINFGVAVVCIIFFIRALSALKDAIETKYMLE